MISSKAKIRLEDLVDYLILKSREMITAQGHKATGKLIRSLEPRTEETPNNWTAKVFWEAYGAVIEGGLHRSRVPYSPGSGAKKSKFIDGLIKYVKLKGLRPKKGQTVKGIAFAIATAGKQVGFPLPGSRRFSKTGRRTGAIGETLEKEKRAILLGVKEAGEELIFEFIEEALDDLARFSNFVQII